MKIVTCVLCLVPLVALPSAAQEESQPAAKEGRVTTRFETMDRNGDAKVSFEEMRDSGRQLAEGAEGDETRLASRFDSLDLDQDGFLDREEFDRSAVERSSKERTAGEFRDGSTRVRDLFSRLDADADGKVTPAEMAALRRASGAPFDQGRLDARFARMDANQDGFLTTAEFAQAMATERKGERPRTDEGGGRRTREPREDGDGGR